MNKWLNCHVDVLTHSRIKAAAGELNIKLPDYAIMAIREKLVRDGLMTQQQADRLNAEIRPFRELQVN